MRSASPKAVSKISQAARLAFIAVKPCGKGLIVLLLVGCASAQPRWVTAPPQGYRNNYFVGEGSAGSQETAKQVAVATALTRIAESEAVAVESRTAIKTVGTSGISAKGQLQDGVSIQFARDVITASGTGFINGVRVVEEFTEVTGTQRNVWVLVSAPKASGLRTLPTRQSAVLRSVLLPGWGQYTLGRERTGLLLGASVLATVPTGMALLNARQQNLRLAEATLIQQSRIRYTNTANSMGTLANVSLAAAGSLWAYSIINAASAPFRIYVDAGPNGQTMGLSLRLNDVARIFTSHTAEQ